MNCKDCKHFTKNNDDLSGNCNNDKFVTGYGNSFVDSGAKRENGYLRCLIEPDGVMLEDDEGWGFMVGKDFGCIHFEQK